MKTIPDHLTRIDLRELPAPERRPLVFNLFERLQPGETLLLTHNHHSTLLHYLLLAEAPKKVSWEYLEKGPSVWRIRIRKNEATGTSQNPVDLH